MLLKLERGLINLHIRYDWAFTAIVWYGDFKCTYDVVMRYFLNQEYCNAKRWNGIYFL